MSARAAALRRFLGTGAGLGRLPRAPGTWASLGTIVLAAPLLGVDGWLPGVLPADPWTARAVVLAVVLGILLLGIAVGNRAASDFGSHDPSCFVLDEVAGQLLAVLPALPSPSWTMLLLAFGAFRFFDVTKPPPCRRLESLPGGLGIMADDVAAGILAACVLLLAGRLV